MIIAPNSFSEVASGTVQTAAAAFSLGMPAANLFTDDPLEIAELRGTFDVVAGTSDKIDFDEGGGELTATLTAATYLSPMELCIQVATQMNAVGSNWRASWLQGSTDRFRFKLERTSGTASLLNETGTNQSDSALKALCGFANYDRATAAAHTGDFAALHTTQLAASNLWSGCNVLVDLGSAKPAHASFLANPRLSVGGGVDINTGDTTAVSDDQYRFEDSIDSEVMGLVFSSVTTRRYVRLTLLDPRRTDWPRLGAGHWFYGPVFDTNASDLDEPIEWEVGSYGREMVSRTTRTQSVAGHPKFGEVAPGERFSVTFRSGPGLSSRVAPALEDLAAALGVSNYCFVALDPDNEPHRETRYCRLTEAPSFVRERRESVHGRWGLTLTFETVDIR